MTEKSIDPQLGDTAEMRINKACMNVFGWDIKDHVLNPQPKIGDKVFIHGVMKHLDDRELLIIRDLRELTVKDILPVIDEMGDTHCWSYSIRTCELGSWFRQNNYKITTPAQA